VGGTGGPSSTIDGCVTGRGGHGGNGGAGGDGGPGGGGGGGPSFGVVLGGGSAISDYSVDVTYDVAPGGAGGASSSTTSMGEMGLSVETYVP
jgi:hypothetical protein